LGEPPLAGGAHLEHLDQRLFDETASEGEAPVELLVLEVVAQLDQREDLTCDVAVLTPTTDLVVVQLGIGVPERGRFGVLVHV
jgi:hypothetical protein